MNANAGYAHRLNDDGTFDSICLLCYHIVSTAPSEPELVFGEAQHLCPPTAAWRRRSFENSLRQPTPSTRETASETLGTNAEER